MARLDIEGVSTMVEHDEREELRRRQTALERRSVELQRETERLQGSRDLGALRAHEEQLRLHELDVHAFRERLDAFHELFGPLGRKEDAD